MATLREIFTPLVAYTLFLTGTPAEHGRPFAEIRQEFERLLEQQRAMVKRHDIAPQDYENACFAIIAWVDEAVTRCARESNPELFSEWRRAPLQVGLFNTANAGQEFFERLALLTPAQKQVIELYHLALCLGFRGRYYDESQDAQLIELRRQYGAQLPAPLLEPLEFEQRQEYLTPQPYAVRAPEVKPPRLRPSPYWLAAPAIVAAALLLYLLPRNPDRRAVEHALRGFDCASISVEAIDKGRVTLKGHVTSDEQREEVQRSVFSVSHVKAVSDNFTLIPRPFCEVMEVLAPAKSESAAQGFALGISPNKGCDGTYHLGESMIISVSAKKPLHFVYVDYYVADRENVAHLLPNSERPDNNAAGSAALTIGGPGDKQQWTIRSPFGREMVTVLSSPKPLFSTARPVSEPDNEYIPLLREALAADGADNDLAADFCFTVSASG
ncbi:MAG: DotU/TssL family secretion system protein [Deltaproteobacteria bacterium]|nr:DotU/TssL family secretion system protein [Deltaproteobacteria bacterium]